MRGNRVVNLRTNAVRCEEGFQRITLGTTDHELVENMPRPASFLGQSQRPFEQHSIAFGVVTARKSPSLQVRELRAQNCGLQGVQTEVAAQEPTLMFGGEAMIA